MKPLIIAGRPLKSRLFVGTGKYPSPRILAEALAASGCELVTVALRRVNFSEPDPTLQQGFMVLRGRTHGLRGRGAESIQSPPLREQRQ